GVAVSLLANRYRINCVIDYGDRARGSSLVSLPTNRSRIYRLIRPLQNAKQNAGKRLALQPCFVRLARNDGNSFAKTLGRETELFIEKGKGMNALRSIVIIGQTCA
ncbi:MAG: hypothetical protein Q4D65_06145, partial [Peptostreptococcaceae bacterium]|nr:hypothetical protein [Peptostreptococcaceae bacterium]